MTWENDSLDPQDWQQFRTHAHRLLDACIDRLENADKHPWQPVPDTIRGALSLGDAEEGMGIEAVAREMVERVMPYATGNTPPRFFGWVHGTGPLARTIV
jgi:hypothetical protein